MFTPTQSGPIITDFPRHELTTITCELAADHHGPHADFLGEVSITVQIWLLWTPSSTLMVSTPGCETTDTTKHPVEQDACTLLADHPTGHSWQLTDDQDG